MVSWTGIAYYVFLVLGGIGFGYFVLRLTNPDVRVMRTNEKLGASFFYGLVLFIVAFIIDYLVSANDFLEATGYLPITIFITILGSIFFLKVKNMMSNPQFLLVGVPAPRAQKDAEPKATFDEIKFNIPNSAKPSLPSLKGISPQDFEKRDAPEKEKPTQQRGFVPFSSAPSQAKTRDDSIAKEKPKETPGRLVAASDSQGFKPITPFTFENSDAGEQKKGGEKSRAMEAIQAKPPEPSEESSSMKGIIQQPKPPLSPQSIQPQKQMQPAHAASSAAPAGQAVFEGRLEELAARTRKEEERKKNPLNEFIDGIKQTFGAGKQEPGVKVVQIKAATQAGEQRGKVILLPESPEVKPRATTPASTHPIAAIEIRENTVEKAALMKKIQETELDEIAGELVGESKGTPLDETTLHRRYIVKQEEAQKQKQTAAVQQKKEKEREQTPEKEFDTMVQEVYNQLQFGKTKEEVGDKLRLAPPPAEQTAEKRIAVQKPPSEQYAQLQAMQSAQSAFQQVESQAPSSARAPEGPASSSSIFDQLNVISGGKPSGEKTESDVKFVKMPANGAGCPRCHAKNSRIVFCPYCGSGMCANCAPLITPKEDGFEYTCPKCGENVFVQKQAQ